MFCLRLYVPRMFYDPAYRKGGTLPWEPGPTTALTSKSQTNISVWTKLKLLVGGGNAGNARTKPSLRDGSRLQIG